MKQKKDHLKLIKNRKEQQGWKKALRFLFRAVLVLVILFILKQGETYFRINEIEVLGTGSLTAAEIASAGEISKGSSIILLREEKAVSAIRQEFPEVKRVEITRVLPDRITIEIEERKPVACIVTADGFWLMDSAMVPFANSAKPAGGYPLISGIDGKLVIPGVPLDCPARLTALQNFFAAWDGENGFGVEKIDMTDSYNMVVYTEDKLEIWLGDGTEMNDKLDLVELSRPHISAAPETRLDVRSGTRLVVSSNVVKDRKEVDP